MPQAQLFGIIPQKDKIKLGFVQFSPERGAGPRNIELAAILIGKQSAELWVLPELATSGYLFEDRAELLTWAEEVPEGPSIRKLRKLARSLNSALIAGFPEQDGDDIFNSAVVINALGGILGVYRKIQLFDREKSVFTPGDRPPQVWDISDAKVGVMICFDWIFPEITRSLALQGADIIAHPANLVLPHAPEAMRTRCIENHVFSVTSNRIGNESIGDLHYHFIGQSQIIDPSGKRLIAATADEATAKLFEIDLSMSRDKNITPNNHLIFDRRPELYNLT
jgi:predicted amidohydrolase